MTYYINVWRDPRKGKCSPITDTHITKADTVEEIAAGYPGLYYVETIRVDGQESEVLDLEIAARDFAWETREENAQELVMTPSWEPL